MGCGLHIDHQVGPACDVTRLGGDPMKLTELWNTSDRPTISFELFPPRSEKAAVKLERAIDELAALKPDFVSVTFGAGGSTREGSHQLIQRLGKHWGMEVLAYFACYGLGPEAIVEVLDSYQALGVGTILAVRGDTPREGGFEPHPDSFAHASDLVTFVRPRYDFCLGVAGYPEGHIEAESLEQDLAFLKMKVDLGAEFIITNYFYDNRYFFDFVQRCREIGIEVPILPGVMPVYSVKMMEMLAGLCGATITEALRAGIEALGEADAGVLRAFGIEYATEQCAELLEKGVRGIHFYTMDRSASTVGIVNDLRGAGLL
jgi:methylenetetrahydrofolate reductase (NADPH)